ncbi:MAG TPA: type II secretion system F family protein [Stellaceae bacterium]|nr:type II secretion system F family protein [Stellaceae bacterium]
MHLDPLVIFYIAIVVGVLALLEGFYLLIAARSTDKLANRRLRLLANQSDQRSAYQLLRRKALGEGSAPWLVKWLQASPLRALDDFLTTSGMTLTAKQACTIMAALAPPFFIIVVVFSGLGAVISAVLAVVIAIALPLLVIGRVRKRRLAHIGSQLPDAIDMLARSLRAGHPVPTGIQMVAHEMADPIGSEFGLVSDEMSYGLDFKDALEKMGERVPLPDINYMIVAMRIQHGTGGSLAEILSSLSSVIRARQNLFGKVKALSAESRFAGKILAGMPIAVVVVLLMMNPHYYDDAKTSRGLAITLGLAAALYAMGVLGMRKVVNIRV